VRRTGFTRRALLATGLMLAALPRAQAAEDAVAVVERYLAGLKTLQADFVQVVRDRQGQITDRSYGTLRLSRPDRFRWDYREPYVQTIVADGQRLWLHDDDLQQVTVRPLEGGLGATPAALLSGSGKVSALFAASGIDEADGWRWCRLTPLQPGSDFERVSLAFTAGGELAAMELRDKLGQSTRVDFENLRRNPALDAALFRFTPPKGVDVIGQVD
jgi:outer membrane lipoprotein carrier protein